MFTKFRRNCASHKRMRPSTYYHYNIRLCDSKLKLVIAALFMTSSTSFNAQLHTQYIFNFFRLHEKLISGTYHIGSSVQTLIHK